MRKWKPRNPARKPVKVSDGTGSRWRHWLRRARSFWLHTPDGPKLIGRPWSERRITRDQAREFIGRNAGRVWVAYHEMFAQVTVELM